MQAIMCCRVLGYYISPEVWCKLVLPAVRTSAGCFVRGIDQGSTVAVGPFQSTSCLKVLVGILHGSTSDSIQQYLQVINILAELNIACDYIYRGPI